MKLQEDALWHWNSPLGNEKGTVALVGKKRQWRTDPYPTTFTPIDRRESNVESAKVLHPCVLTPIFQEEAGAGANVVPVALLFPLVVHSFPLGDFPPPPSVLPPRACINLDFNLIRWRWNKDSGEGVVQ